MLFVNEMAAVRGTPAFLRHMPALGRTLLVGTVRSILFAWLVVRLAGAMRARGLRLHV